MNDSTDKHAPTDEFVEYLARDTARRLRHEARFALPPNEVRSRSRITSAFAIAAGVVMILSTGMVLGASANYASAAVLPNGTTTIPSRPALAILPIKSALTAIGCTQAPERTVAATTPAPGVATAPAPVAVTPISEPAVVDQVATPSVPANIDRAAIAAYAKQYQASVVRGDTAAEFIVMALDASNNYVWSTHGSGNVTIEVGGDSRTFAERDEYNRLHSAEYLGKTMPGYLYGYVSSDSAARTWRLSYRGDSAGDDLTRYYRYQVSSDTMSQWTRGYKATARVQADTTYVVGGRGSVTFRADSGVKSRRRFYAVTDSNAFRNYDFVFAFGAPMSAACGAGAPLRAERTRVNSDNSLQGTYTAGWSDARGASRCNQAKGLHERAAGESGIVGLASSNVSAAEAYMFAAGELAPHELKVMVVHLTPGTQWRGR